MRNNSPSVDADAPDQLSSDSVDWEREIVVLLKAKKFILPNLNLKLN
jgi:hypothetical protein